jgi:hypothetical protein
MAYLRYSVLNSSYHRGVLDGWEKGGCMPEIQRRMGYRFRLVGSAVPGNVKPGGAVRVSFTVSNDGWANLYNPRPVEIVLRNTATRQEFRLPVKSDPRSWMPGETKTVEATGNMPAEAPAGSYEVLLHLPDAAPGLRSRAEYSIRFANQGLWEPSSGMNSLQQTIKVGR